MNYLFLDIDGVLNCYDDFRKAVDTKIKLVDISSNKLILLKEIVDKTNCKIVLSSSWRIGLPNDLQLKNTTGMANKLLKVFNEYGLKIYDKTPVIHVDDSKWDRPFEIIAYIKSHLKKYDKYVVLDDEDAGMSDAFSKYFVKTDFNKDGLTKEHVNRIISLFNE